MCVCARAHVYECGFITVTEEDGRWETSSPHLHPTALLSYRRGMGTAAVAACWFRRAVIIRARYLMLASRLLCVLTEFFSL